MEKPIVNIFQKGAILDIDKLHDPGEAEGYWTLPSRNIRILPKDGTGFTITPMKGNIKVDGNGNIILNGETFKLKTGYIPLSYCTFDGIIYIASVYKDPFFNVWHGELGSFPSIDYVGGGTTFTRDYRAFHNYKLAITDPSPIELNSPLFKWTPDSNISMFGQKDYDGSVNIYLADHQNRNRIINSGFRNNGTVNNRFYVPEDFNGKINQFPTTNTTTKVTLNKIVAPGSLLCGNYIFYFRLLTVSFDNTDIIAESGPCQVYTGGSFTSDANNHEGTVMTVSGGDKDTDSGKSIHLHLDGLDTTYRYLEVYYTRYFSDDNDVLIHENRKINFNYDITGPSMDIVVFGNESSAIITDDALLDRYPDDIACKSHCQSEGYYWGANWKTRIKHNDALISFSKLITLNYDVMELWSPTVYGNNNAHPSWNQYKDYFLTYNKVGHFRTEVYPYVAIYEFNDGTFSDGYPVTGIDALGLSIQNIEDIYDTYFLNLVNGVPFTNPNYFDLTGTVISEINIINQNGLMRMPGYNIQNGSKNTRLWKHGPNNDDVYVKPLYVISDFKRALEWLNSSTPHPYTGDKQWIKDNVRAIHIARADRIPNLKYQGLAMGGVKCVGDNVEEDYTYNFVYPEPTVTLAHKNITNSSPTLNYCMGPIEDPYSGDGEFNICDQSYSDESNVQFEFKQRVLIPIYRAYIPIHWYKKNKLDADNAETKRIVNLNRAAQGFYEKGKYGLYSFDYLFRKLNIIDSIGYAIRVNSNMYSSGNLSKYCINTIKDNSSGHLGNRNEARVFPKGLLAELASGWMSYSEDSYANFSSEYHFDGINNFIQNAIFYGYRPKDDIENVGEQSFQKIDTIVGKSFGWANYSDDYYSAPNNTMFYMVDGTGIDRAQFWTNRTLLVQKYLGLNIDFNGSASEKDFNNGLVNLYKTNPYSIFDINKLYTPEELFYKIVSVPITMDELENEYAGTPGYDGDMKREIWRGDCFLQRQYFKQMYWNGCTFGKEDSQKGYDEIGFDTDVTDNADGASDCGEKLATFSHGLIVGFVSECAFNTSMRHAGKTTTYYPKNSNLKKYAISPYDAGGIESLLLNKGYSVTRSQRSFPHYFKKMPENILNHEVRIYHSLPFAENAYINNFRKILSGNFVDFDPQYGPINFVGDTGRTLISIQDGSINQHYTGEKEQKVPTTEGEVTIGTGPILSKTARSLALFGSQHMKSVVVTDNAVYGVDAKRRMIWGTQAQQTTSGTISLAARDLTLEKFFAKWINETLDEYGSQSDKTYIIKETPANGEGIVVDYDKKYLEAYFSFIRTVDKNVVVKTIRYNELVQGFIDEPDTSSIFYASVNDDFYSTSMLLTGSSHLFYQNDIGPILNFYGIIREFKLSVISKGLEGMQLGHKIFLSQDIHTNHVSFKSIEWSTENAYGILTPFDPLLNTVRPWLSPKYGSNYWHVPINVKSDPSTPDYLRNANMRGTWLKTTITYQNNVSIFVKNIITNYITSKI